MSGPDPAAAMPPALRRHLSFAAKVLASLLISAFFVWLSLRHADLPALQAALRAVRPIYLGEFLAVLLAIHLVRTLRFGLLLQPIARVPFKKLNAVCAVSFMALVTLPLRLGEVARPVLLAEPGRIRRSAAMASVVVERVVDGLCIGLLLMAMLFSLGPRATGNRVGYVRLGGGAVAAIFLAALGVLLAMVRMREQATRQVQRLIAPWSPRLAERVAERLASFASGLHFGKGRAAPAFFGLTFLYWGLNAVGLMLLAPAFGFHLGAREACTVLSMQVIGVMIPAGPGMLGTMQYFSELGLSLFIPAAQMSGAGTAFANVVWAMQFGQQVATGLVFLALGHISFGRVLAAAEGDEAREPALEA